MRSRRVPDMDSIEEISRFWDTHDLTDFEDQLEEVRTPVFARRKEATVAIALTLREAEVLKRLAQSEGVKEAKLVRNWVREKLRESSLNERPNNYQASPRQGHRSFPLGRRQKPKRRASTRDR